MRKSLIAGLAAVLGTLGPAAAAEHTSQPDRLARPGASGQESSEAPRVLRGSAVAPRAEAAPPVRQRFRMLAGELLWVVDTKSGEIVACRERDTFNVGKRLIRCTTGDLP